MRVLVDLHGGDPDDVLAKAEYTEIKERVMFEVGKLFLKCTLVLLTRPQRESGEGRTYAVMWKRYKRRVDDGYKTLCHPVGTRCYSYHVRKGNQETQNRTEHGCDGKQKAGDRVGVVV